MFGIVVSGRPVILANQHGSCIVQETPESWIVDVANPGQVCECAIFSARFAQIADISFFLISALPSWSNGDPTGLAIYFSCFPFENWEFLTALSNSKPSIIINAGWSLNPLLDEAPSVRVGLRIEQADAIITKVSTMDRIDFKRDYARKIALNLFRFIESFSQGPSRDGNFLRCPQDVLDRWIVRFNEKYERDPNFILKSN